MNWNAISKMAQSGAVHGLNMTEVRSTNNCLPCVQRMMSNIPMRFRFTWIRGLELYCTLILLN